MYLLLLHNMSYTWKEGVELYPILMALIGYLTGCMNGSQIISKYKHINIRNGGSKNAGATNTALQIGMKYGAFVAFIDVFKAIISLYLAALLLMNVDILFEYKILLLYINAVFIIIGHNFPITMQFKGGKGTASFLGVLLFMDWRFAMVAFLIFLLIALATNYFVIGTLAGYLAFIAYTILMHDKGPVYLSFVLTFLFLFKHIDNFKRIAHKEERKLSSLFHKEAG